MDDPEPTPETRKGWPWQRLIFLVALAVVGFAVWWARSSPLANHGGARDARDRSDSASTLDAHSAASLETAEQIISQRVGASGGVFSEVTEEEIARTQKVFDQAAVFKKKLRDREIPRYRVIHESTAPNGDAIRVGVLERPSPGEVEAAHVEAGSLLDEIDPGSRKLARWLLESALEDHLSFSGRFRFLASRTRATGYVGYVHVRTGFTEDPADALPDETGAIETIRGSVRNFAFPGDEMKHPRYGHLLDFGKPTSAEAP